MYLYWVKTRIKSRFQSPFVLSFHPDRAVVWAAVFREQRALLPARNDLEPKNGLRVKQPAEADPVGGSSNTWPNRPNGITNPMAPTTAGRYPVRQAAGF